MRNPLSRDEYHDYRQLPPWQLTLPQFVEVINYSSGKKWLEDYDPWTLESFKWVKITVFPRLINKKIFKTPFGKRSIEFRGSTEKLHYVKSDPETDQHLRDSAGQLIYYTDEEILNKKWNLYEIGIYVFDGETCIGSVADEWGGTLLAIAQEYWRSGIAVHLYKLFDKLHPYRCAGGFTSSGYRLMEAVHRSYVQDALNAGERVDIAIIQSSCSHVDMITGPVQVEECGACGIHERLLEDTSKLKHYGLRCLKCSLSGKLCGKSQLLLWDDGKIREIS